MDTKRGVEISLYSGLTHAHDLRKLCNRNNEVNMKKLEILFGEKQHLCISDLMSALGANKSEVSRAAMQLGLMQIKELAARSPNSAQELIAMNDFKSRG